MIVSNLKLLRSVDFSAASFSRPAAFSRVHETWQVVEGQLEAKNNDSGSWFKQSWVWLQLQDHFGGKASLGVFFWLT